MSAKELIGSIIGEGAGIVFISFLWKRLPFLPSTTMISSVTAIAGILIGFLGDGVLRNQYRSIRRQLVACIASLVLFAILYWGYSSYVIWATKAGRVEGWPAYLQYAILLVMHGFWGLAWSAAGRLVFHRA